MRHPTQKPLTRPIPTRSPWLIRLITTLSLVAFVSVAWADHSDSMPAANTPDLVEAAAGNDQTQTLTALVKLAGLTVVLEGDGPFTVLAPTDDAFAQLPAETVEALKAPQNRSLLREVLLYHVLPGAVTADQFRPTQSLMTAAGTRLAITRRNGQVTAGDANVIAADLRVRNGVIHVIDRVLLPPTLDLQRIDDARKMIDLAIQRGVPLFNHGNQAACAAIYEVAAHGLLAIKSEHGAIQSAQMQARRALTLIDDRSSRHSVTDRAWVLRRALDSADRTLAAAQPSTRMNTTRNPRDTQRLEQLRALGLPVDDTPRSAQR